MQQKQHKFLTLISLQQSSWTQVTGIHFKVLIQVFARWSCLISRKKKKKNAALTVTMLTRHYSIENRSSLKGDSAQHCLTVPITCISVNYTYRLCSCVSSSKVWFAFLNGINQLLPLKKKHTYLHVFAVIFQHRLHFMKFNSEAHSFPKFLFEY